MKYKAIIFDLDGTIADTERLWKEASEQLVKRRKPLGEEQATTLREALHGRSMPDAVFIIKQMMALEEQVHELMQEKIHIVSELYQTGVRFIEGFQDFFHKTQTYQLKTAIATNAGITTLQETDKALGLSTLFGQHMYCASHVSKPKPDPMLYLHAADNIGVIPTACIAVEDSAHGITAAKEAGMYCIGINTNKNAQQLQHADTVVDAYDEIDLPALLTLNK